MLGNQRVASQLVASRVMLSSIVSWVNVSHYILTYVLNATLFTIKY
jgi:hypothetical protein